eukprot:2667121-Rhodomonas_salina.3
MVRRVCCAMCGADVRIRAQEEEGTPLVVIKQRDMQDQSLRLTELGDALTNELDSMMVKHRHWHRCVLLAALHSDLLSLCVAVVACGTGHALKEINAEGCAAVM